MSATIAESFSAASLDFDTLLELSRRTDPVGVLSIYVDARPGGGPRAAAIELKNRLTDLERRLVAEASPAKARSIQEGIARLEGEVERLSDPEEPGRGRVLFAALSETWLVRASARLPFRNRVVLDGTPFIHPLLELLDEAGPVGVVLASRAHARLLEWRLGDLTPLRELHAEMVEPPHERSGPVGSRPGARYGTPTREQRDARQRDHATRFIERTATAASRLAPERGWNRVLVSAGEQLTDSLLGALPPGLRELAVPDRRVLVGLDLAALERVVTERIRAAHGELERGLIRNFRERAHGAGAAALGLSEVVGALNQARVAHLIYDPLIRYRGSVGYDGTLYAYDEGIATFAATADLRLTERIVERALETGARVTPIEGATSDGLAEASGIAAVLRW
jgi:hypothetical protein